MTSATFLSISEMISVHARNRPTARAWIDGDEIVDWYHFDRYVSEAATALAALGVKQGDAVAFMVDSTIWSWTQIFATIRVGGVAVPLNTLQRAESLASMLVDSSAKVLVVSGSWTTLAAETDQYLRETARPGRIEEPAESHDRRLDLDGTRELRTFSAITPETTCTITYSSGTTGEPKGIVHSQHARVHTAMLFATMYRVRSDSSVLLCTPPHTNGSWIMVLPMVFVGGTTILCRGGFEPASYLRTIKQHRPDLAFVVPAMAQRLLDHPASRTADWSSFGFILTAGAPMPAKVKQRFRELTGERLGELWGLTEGFTTIIQPHEMEEHPDSVGRAAPGTDLRIIGPDDTEVDANVEGEIVGRSTWMMSGYHGRDDATRDIVWTSPDGIDFIRSGDIATRDADGWITIRGRTKEMLISGGINVYPIDIEEEFRRHPAVADVAVIGSPDVKWGEVPVAFVVLRDAVDGSALKEWANGRLAKHQRVAWIEVIDDLPRNTLGKVVKSELARQ